MVWSSGANDVTATPAPPLLMVVHLRVKQRLTDDAEDNLLPVARHLGALALLTQRTDHPGRERMVAALRLAIGTGAVSAMPLGLPRVARVRLPIAAGARHGLVAAFRRRVGAGRRRAPRRVGAGRRRARRRLGARTRFAGIAARLTRVLRCGSRGDLADHAFLPSLGAYNLVPDQGADEGPVAGLRLSLLEPAVELTESV